ncbi:MAG: hypothetical protein OXC69_10330 [Candidatus Tectomicrobia bacterium]|nr:hypothetical protein [Candidatus Tectomicrobia bacterium]
MLVVLTMMGMLGAVASVAAQQPDPERFAAQALALRIAAIEREDAATTILAMIPGSAPAEVLPALWHPFFENAIVKLGRLRAPAPVALYYNPLLDIALITFWEQKDGHYRVAMIRALPGERLAVPTATVSNQPAWMVAVDPITTLAEITTRRLDTFRQAHPARTQDTAGRDDVTFVASTANMRTALPRLLWNTGIRTQWTAEAEPWLFPALAQIDEALATRTPVALTTAAPDTDATVANAIAGLPTVFAARLTLDMVLPAGKENRLLIGSMPDDGDVYLFVLCRMKGPDCALRRFMLLSLSGYAAKENSS